MKRKSKKNIAIGRADAPLSKPTKEKWLWGGRAAKVLGILFSHFHMTKLDLKRILPIAKMINNSASRH